MDEQDDILYCIGNMRTRRNICVSGAELDKMETISLEEARLILQQQEKQSKEKK